MNSHQIWRVQLKKCARYAHSKFLTFLAGNPNLRHEEPSNLVQSGHLLRFTTGENLVLMSQTTFEKFENNQNLSFPLFLQWYILYLQRYKMYHWRYKVNDKLWLILDFSKAVWDITIKFSPVVVLIRIQLSS